MFSKIGQFPFDYKAIENTSKHLRMISLIQRMLEVTGSNNSINA